MKAPKRAASGKRKFTSRRHELECLEPRTVLSAGPYSLGVRDSYHEPIRHDRADGDRMPRDAFADIGRHQPDLRDHYQFDSPPPSKSHVREPFRSPDRFPPPPPPSPSPKDLARHPPGVAGPSQPVASRPAPPAVSPVVHTPVATPSNNRPVSLPANPASPQGAQNQNNHRSGNSALAHEIAELVPGGNTKKSSSVATEISSAIEVGPNTNTNDPSRGSQVSRTVAAIGNNRNEKSENFGESLLSRLTSKFESKDDAELLSTSRELSSAVKLLAHTEKSPKDERDATGNQALRSSSESSKAATEDEGGTIELESSFADVDRGEDEDGGPADNAGRSHESDFASQPQRRSTKLLRPAERWRTSEPPGGKHLSENSVGLEHDFALQESVWQDGDEQGGLIELIAVERSQMESIRFRGVQLAAANQVETGEIEVDGRIGLHQAFQLAGEAIVDLSLDRMATDELAAEEADARFEFVDAQLDEDIVAEEAELSNPAIGAAALSPLIAVAGVSVWLQHQRCVKNRPAQETSQRSFRSLFRRLRRVSRSQLRRA